TAGMKFQTDARRCRIRLEFDEDAAYFFDIFVFANEMFVAQKISEAEFTSLPFGLRASVEWAVLSPQLLGRVAGHPKGFFIDHCRFAPGEFFASSAITVSRSGYAKSRQAIFRNSSAVALALTIFF